MQLKTIFLVCFLLLCGQAHARSVYYASCTGNNTTGDGTIGNPWYNGDNAEGVGFLNPGDKLLWKKGCTYENSRFTPYSSGTRFNPVFIGTYGTGTDPILRDSVDLAIYNPVMTLDDAIYNVWSVVTDSIPWTPDTMSMDDAYGLQNRTAKNDLNYGGNGFFRESATQYYFRLDNNEDPNDHTFRLGRYTGTYNGVIDIPEGYNDIMIWGLHVVDSNHFGIVTRGERTRLMYVTVERSANDGIMFGRVDVALENEGAKDSVCIGCTVRDNVTTSNGQGITVEAPNVGVYDSLIELNNMAGLDYLDYQADTTDRGTDASGFAMRNTIRNNGALRHSNSWDPQLYVDGGHDVYIIDNVIYGGGQQLTTGYNNYATQNYQPGINISSENCGHYPSNIYIINNHVFGNRGPAVTMTDGSCAGENLGDVYLYGNTLKTGTGAFQAMNIGGLSPTAKVVSKNNIIYGGSPSIDISTAAYPYMQSNNNLLYGGYRIGWGTSYSLSEWQTFTGQEVDSIYADPKFKNNADGYLSALWNTAEGDASDSPAIGAGDPTALNITMYGDSIGSYRLDGTDDDVSAPAIGYHNNYGWSSWNGLNVSTTLIRGASRMNSF